MQTARNVLLAGEAPGALIRTAWDRLSPLPGGRRLFSRVVGCAAPYTGTMRAHVLELSAGHSRVELRDRRAVQNHLRSVHAIALANLAELTGNVAVAYSLPDDARFIVAGLSIDYIKKGHGTIIGTCDVEPIRSSERREYDFLVELRDDSGELVARSVLKTLVGPRRKS